VGLGLVVVLLHVNLAHGSWSDTGRMAMKTENRLSAVDESAPSATGVFIANAGRAV
jgi:hypothetical protein